MVAKLIGIAVGILAIIGSFVGSVFVGVDYLEKLNREAEKRYEESFFPNANGIQVAAKQERLIDTQKKIVDAVDEINKRQEKRIQEENEKLKKEVERLKKQSGGRR